MKRVIPAVLLAGFASTGTAQNLDSLTGALGGTGSTGQLQSLLTGFGNPGASLGPDTLVTALNNVDDATNALITGTDYREDGLQGAALAALDPDSPDVGNVTQAFNNGNAAFQGFAAQLAAGTPAESLAASYIALTNTGYDVLLPAYMMLDGPAEMLVSAGAPLTGPLHDAIAATDLALTLNFDDSGLPALGADSLGSGGLSLDQLPLSADSLDSGTLTMLTSGDALNGIQ